MLDCAFESIARLGRALLALFLLSSCVVRVGFTDDELDDTTGGAAGRPPASSDPTCAELDQLSDEKMRAATEAAQVEIEQAGWSLADVGPGPLVHYHPLEAS